MRFPVKRTLAVGLCSLVLFGCKSRSESVNPPEASRKAPSQRTQDPQARLKTSAPGKNAAKGAPITSPVALDDCDDATSASAEQMSAEVQGRAKIIRKGSWGIKREGDFEYWGTSHGSFWVVANNFGTMTKVLAEQEMEHYGNKKRGVQSGDVVLDGGAHFGGFVRAALKRGAKLVVAIELAAENCDCLKRTFAEEIKAGKVIVYPKGVWHKDDVLYIKKSLRTWGHSVTVKKQSDKGERAYLTTIDKIVSELKLTQVDFIKLDIEGSEQEALSGARGTIARFKPRMAIASYHRKEDKQVLSRIALAANKDYKICVNGKGWGNEMLFFQ